VKLCVEGGNAVRQYKAKFGKIKRDNLKRRGGYG
jgi:hypothetical protein